MRTIHLILLTAALGITCLLGAAACDEDQILTTTRNLNRPGPLALVCAGRSGDGGTATGLSPSRCTTDAGTVDGVKGTLYGFVANTAKGEVAVFRPGATSTIDLLVDLDKGSPGYGFIPVGTRPTDLVASQDGCMVVTANSGSCDLALIDVPAVMDVAASLRKKPSGSVVSRMAITTASGRRLRARPQEMVLVPSTDKPKIKQTDVCPAATSLRAYVTFPSCNLVAEVDLASGKIKQGLVLHSDGTISRNDDPACPAECTMSGDDKLIDMGAPDQRPVDQMVKPDAPQDAGAKDGVSLDAGVPDGSGKDGGTADIKPGQPDLPGAADAGPSDLKVSTRGVLPHGLALQAISDTASRLFVSSAGAGFIWALDIKDDNLLLTPTKVMLEGGPTTSRLKLSPAPRNAKVGRYLYAIANDRTVRVISLASSPGLECETQLDLAKISDKEIALEKAGCYVVSDATRKLRRVTATGPGLAFGQRAPLDVEFISNPLWQVDAQLLDTRPQTTPLQGIYAMISVSDGLVYVVDIEDWTLVKADSTNVPRLRLPHRRRNLYLGQKREEPDASTVSVTGATTGGVPVLVSRVSSTSSATDAGGDVPGHGLLLRAPGESISTDWYLTYEERLVARWSGAISLENGELIFRDKGAKFCAAGVEGRSVDKAKRLQRHGDLLILVGCRDDNECGLGQECIKAIGNPSEYGMCLEKGREDDLYSQCLPFLGAKREFVITEAKGDQLKLDILSEVPTHVWDIKKSGCTTNADCPDQYLCALKDQTATGLKQGDCFRTGCRPKAGDSAQRSNDCASNHRCIKPLDNAPEVCSPVPRPIDMIQGVACTSDAQCDPNQAATKPAKLNAACGTNSDCGGANALMECRKSPITAAQARCISKGMTCQAVGPAGAKVCARVSPCFNQLLRYDVRAGRSFIVGGYKRGVEDPLTGLCRADSNKSALYNNRIYIGQPVFPAVVGEPCKPGDVRYPETPAPNGCYEVSKTEGYSGVKDVVSETSFTLAKDSPPSTMIRFSNPDVWFNLGVSHLAKPNSGNADAGADASPVPAMPTRNLTLRMGIGSGFFPLRVGSATSISLPARLVAGPDGFVYLVDMGDRPGTAGTNGQVLRISASRVLLDNFAVR